MKQNEFDPYVGPRPFERKKEDAARFFGRSQETDEIVSLIFGHPVLLVYAQSGAGKTSLFNASVTLILEDNGFDVLPLTRVGGGVPKGVALQEIKNLYIFNALLKMDSETNPRTLLSKSLSTFLETRNRATDENGQPRPRVIVFDQFEELFTYTPEHWQEQREGFFLQVVDALNADPLLRVVFVIREDFLAELDPYARILPERLRTRYRLERLGKNAALRAIKDPLANTPRTFASGVAEGLVKELLVMRTVDATGKMAEIEGQYVEPVQLQVVCVTLWSTLKPEVTEIQKIHLENFNVNDALSNFYKSAVESADRETGVPETDLRNWFEKTLITPMGTRSTVFRGENSTGGIENRAVDFLESRHIIRAEFRAGARWYELTHDRFVGPILQANRKWAGQNQKSVMTDATAWKKSGKPDSYLYDGKQLESSLAELEAHPDRFSSIEKEFIRTSQRAAARRRRRFWFALGTATFVFILVLVGLLIWNVDLANTAAARAATAELDAIAARTESVNGIKVAITATYVETLQAVITTQDAQIATLQVMAFPHTPTLEGATISPDPSATLTPTPIPLSERVIGYSAGNKEIRVFSFGNGPRHIVMVGGLHAGFAPSTVIMAQALKEYLTNNLNLIPANITVDLITIANPDSLPPSGRDFSGAINGRLNANQVDLNRNWGCDWSPNAVWQNKSISGGSAEFSEPETIALSKFFTSDKLTVAVVFWEARDNPPSVSPGGCGDFSVYSDPLSRLYAAGAGYRAQDFTAYAINGDATNWLDSQGIGAITVLLPSYTDLSPDDFNRNVNAVKQVLEIYGR
jgi:hypothetical protein